MIGKRWNYILLKLLLFPFNRAIVKGRVDIRASKTEEGTPSGEKCWMPSLSQNIRPFCMQCYRKILIKYLYDFLISILGTSIHYSLIILHFGCSVFSVTRDCDGQERELAIKPDVAWFTYSLFFRSFHSIWMCHVINSKLVSVYQNSTDSCINCINYLF